MKHLFVAFFISFVTVSVAQKLDKPKMEFSHRITGDHNFPLGQTSIKYHLGFKTGIHDFYLGIGPSAQFEFYSDEPFLGYATEINYFVGKNKSKFGMNLEFGSYYVINYDKFSNFPNGNTFQNTFLNVGYAYRGDYGFEIGIYYGCGLYNEARQVNFWPLNLKLVVGLDFINLKKAGKT